MSPSIIDTISPNEESLFFEFKSKAIIEFVFLLFPGLSRPTKAGRGLPVTKYKMPRLSSKAEPAHGTPPMKFLFFG